ncbi:hypothetical protein E9531_09605 [Lampropedia puyangensis]|uniref:CorA-like Mg2+ transporter protein n=1 Tax=Lampropedia puyangensis TaxID=1330072 RepID=A0A4S8F179_9BURK|nr:hypothetical protein [Lampropedia puyangensis]THU01030.1 hypothetical protein E9531_09605 [Lampropedia puyangensis]
MTRRERYKWPVSEAITRRLGAASFGAQRAIFEDGQLLLVLHAPPQASKARDHEIFLRLPDNEPQGQWLYKGQKGGQRVLEELLLRYEKELSRLSNALDIAENAAALFSIIGDCIPITRAAVNLQKTMEAGRNAVKEDQWLIDQRDKAVEIARNFELLLADARLDLDYKLAQAAEQQTRATEAVIRAQRKLNTIAALTFPVMALGAAWGMNLQSGLEAANPALFWLVIVIGILLGLVVRLWIKQDEK